MLPNTKSMITPLKCGFVALAAMASIAIAPRPAHAQSMADTLDFLTRTLNDDERGRHFFLVAEDNPCDIMCGYLVGNKEYAHAFLITDVDFDSIAMSRSKRSHDFMKFTAFGRQELFDYEVSNPDGEVVHHRESPGGQCIVPMQQSREIYNALMHLSMMCKGQGIGDSAGQ